jgi:endoribonuclease Dicer
MGQASGNPKGKMKENHHLNQSQSKIIHQFRDGTCNLLVATSVLEEGVDVRACNLVIRFDGRFIIIKNRNESYLLSELYLIIRF